MLREVVSRSGSVEGGELAQMSRGLLPRLIGVFLSVAILILALSWAANGLPTVSVSDESAMEGDGVITFTVTLSEESSSIVHVGYYTKDDTAVAPNDYTETHDGLEIPVGETTATFKVPIVSDTLVESDETFFICLINVNGATWVGGNGVGTIVDSPTVSIGDRTDYETVGTLRFTVTLSKPSPAEVHVGYHTSNGTATSPDDYTHTQDGLYIPAGNTSASFPVPIIDDALSEGDETFTVGLVNVNGASVADGQAVGTIVDNERTVSIFSMTATEGDGFVPLQILLSSPSALPVLVWTSSEDVTAVSSDDYSWGLVPVVIPAGAQATILEIPIVDDAEFENREYFKVHIATFPETTAQGTANAIIDDNDGSVSIADRTANENAGSITFTATLSGPAPSAIDITFQTADSTAVAPLDYSSTFLSTQFAPGSTTARFVVPIVDDSTAERDERFSVSITDVRGATTVEGVVAPFFVNIVDGQATGTILDNEPRVSINDVTTGEGSGTMMFTVSLSRPCSTTVEVTLSTSEDTASSPSDYSHVNEKVEISAGSTTARFQVLIVDDADPEESEQFDVHIDRAVGASIGDGSGTGTIIDNEPAVTVGDALAEEEGGTMVFPISLSNASNSTVRVSLQTENGSAVAPEDYLQTTGEVLIGPGKTSADFRVPLSDDSVPEPDETFDIVLVSVSGASVADGTGTGTITDNEPIISINDAMAEEDAGTMTFTVALSRPAISPVTVNLSTSGGTATSPDDYKHTSYGQTFAAGEMTKAFAVSLVDDLLDEPDESIEVVLESVSGAGVGDSVGIGTILDNDGPEIDIQRPLQSSIPDGGTDSLGSCPVGAMHLVYIIDNSRGVAPITVSDITIADVINIDGFCVNTDFPLILKPGKTKPLDLTFEIVARGHFNLSIVLPNNDVSENPYNITITGAGVLYSDINDDGVVDLHDVRRCMAIAGGCEQESWELGRADVDGDGDVDAVDVEILAKKVLGI